MNSKNLAVVTGGNRGLGMEVCRQLGKEGYRVYLTSRSEDGGLKATHILMDEGLDVHFYQVDVTDQASVNKFASYFGNIHDRLDVLVNSAAVFYDLGHQVASPDMEAVEEAIHTNTLGPWRMSAALFSSLQKSKNPRVVNVSSSAGAIYHMSGGTPAYSMSKAALNVLTIKMAHEWKKHGIKVNAVCPWVGSYRDGWNECAPKC